MFLLSPMDLLARVFSVDLSECAACGGCLRIIAALTDPASIRTYLEGVGLPAVPPPRAPPPPPVRVRRLTSYAIRSRRQPYGEVRPQVPGQSLKDDEILYHGTLSIPERFCATTSNSSGTLLDPCGRFQRTA